MPGDLVIGEVGGSSSRWAWLPDTGEERVLPLKGRPLLGYNPLSGDAQVFTTNLLERFTEDLPELLRSSRVVVFAAGCSSPDRREAMHGALTGIWPQAAIQVDTDLMGAALGLCGDRPGLVLILGTGMNAGWYDGRHLFTPMPSLGWALGDEGSGADIGRTLLQDAFYGRMPQAVCTSLFGPDGPDLAATLAGIHRSPFPARALAGYTALLVPHTHEPYVRELLTARFHALAELLATFFSPERRMEVHATGSVAHGFREILAECLLDRGMTLMAAEPDPLPGLVRWYRQAP